MIATSRPPRSSQWSITRGAGGSQVDGDAVALQDRRAEVGGDAEALAAQRSRPSTARGPAPVVTVCRARHGARAHAEGGQAAQAVGGDLRLAAVGVDEAHAHAAVLVRVAAGRRRRPSRCGDRRAGAPRRRDRRGAIASATSRKSFPRPCALATRISGAGSSGAAAGGGKVPMHRTFSSFMPALLPPHPAVGGAVDALRRCPGRPPRPESGASGNRSRTGTTPVSPSPSGAQVRPASSLRKSPRSAAAYRNGPEPDEVGDGLAVEPGRRPGRAAVATSGTRRWRPPPRRARDPRRRTTTAPSPAPRPRAAPRPGPVNVVAPSLETQHARARWRAPAPAPATPAGAPRCRATAVAAKVRPPSAERSRPALVAAKTVGSDCG